MYYEMVRLRGTHRREEKYTQLLTVIIECKRPLARPRHEWQNYITLHTQQTGPNHMYYDGGMFL